jgi:hypothetical protein
MSESSSQLADVTALYEEVGQNYRKFLDWREKIVGGYVAVLGGLGIGFHASDGHCGFQSVLLCAAILSSGAFWVLNTRNSRFISTCVAAGKRHEPAGNGVYNSLGGLTHTTRLTHGLAVNLLVSGVIAGSTFKLWIDRSCWYKGEYVCSLAVSCVVFGLLIVLLEKLGKYN